MTTVLQDDLSAIFPQIDPKKLHWAILPSLRLAFDRVLPRESTFRQFKYPVMQFGWSIYSMKPTVPGVSLKFAPALQSPSHQPWIVEMLVQDNDCTHFRIKSLEKPAGHSDGEGTRTKWTTGRTRQILRLAATLGRHRRDSAVIIGMPTLAGALGLSDFYYFQSPGRVPWQWVLAFKPEQKIAILDHWKPKIAELKRLHALDLRKKRERERRLNRTLRGRRMRQSTNTYATGKQTFYKLDSQPLIRLEQPTIQRSETSKLRKICAN